MVLLAISGEKRAGRTTCGQPAASAFRFFRPALAPVSSLRRLGCACLIALALAASSHAEISKEYQLKAAFLYNFTRFIEWPPERLPDKTSPIVIGVCGANPFDDELAALVENRTVHGRHIVVQHFKAGDAMNSAHVVFFPASEATRLAETLATLHRQNVLTVGESPPFAAAGGIITFTLENEKLRFEVNLNASERARLKLSAQLLKLSICVRR